MDNTQRNTKDLLALVKKYEDQLLKRFQNISELAQVPPRRAIGEEEEEEQNNGVDMNQAAYNSLKMSMESAALIRTAEDILSLTRQMKEMWLFGRLNTLGGNEGAERTAEEDASAVGALLERLLEMNNEKPQ